MTKMETLGSRNQKNKNNSEESKIKEIKFKAHDYDIANISNKDPTTFGSPASNNFHKLLKASLPTISSITLFIVSQKVTIP